MPSSRFIRYLSQGLTADVSLWEGDSGLFVRKELSPRARGVKEAEEQLENERLLLELLHGDVAPKLLRAGAAPSPFVELEYIPFPTLAQLRPPKEGGPMLLESTFRAGLVALAHLHTKADGAEPLELVHGDISPSNLLLDPGGTKVRVLDFGLAESRRTRREESDGAFRGTLMYASPEAARSERLDARTDVFSLACAVLHAATGVAPRRGVTRPALLVEAGERPLSEWAEQVTQGVSKEVAHVLIACLSFERDGRPSATAALRAMTPA